VLGTIFQSAIIDLFIAVQRNVVTKPGEVLQGSAPKTFAALIPPMRVYVPYFSSMKSYDVHLI
jgi:hypothetical protein